MIIRKTALRYETGKWKEREGWQWRKGQTVQQFFIDESQVGKEYVTITGPDVHHIKHVLRMKPGEKIRVSTGTQDFFCVIAEIGDEFVQADLLADEEAVCTELPAKITLFQAVPKGDRMETVIEKAVELGVYEIVPVMMKYCVVKLDEKKAANKVRRWQAIAQSAAKQSKRSIIPQVHPVVSYAQALIMIAEHDIRLVPYENARGMAAAQEALASIGPGQRISVLIGPEGGFAPEEIAAARENMQVISLGRRILRTDTAGICVMSLLMTALETMEETGRMPGSNEIL